MDLTAPWGRDYHPQKTLSYGNIPMKVTRKQIEQIIFEADTFYGKLFDILLILFIVASIAVVMLDSIESFSIAYGSYFTVAEWLFTVLFTLEYVTRLATVEKPLKYAFSFFGIIDFLAVVPTYIGLVIPAGKYLLVVRVLRVLRIFRILKLAHYVGEADLLMKALKASRRKILVFIFTVLTLVTLLGALMYMVEGQKNGFTSIPKSIYWAVVTLTTVGYGDISPQTSLGQALASCVMILGFGIIAIPTGIVTAEITRAMGERPHAFRICAGCGHGVHDDDARFCKICGDVLPPMP